jgi:hypothetical protein
VNFKIHVKEENRAKAEILESYLNKVGLSLGIDSEVAELVCEDNDFYGVKAYIGAQAYLDYFEGSFDDLKEALSEVVIREALDTIECKFCHTKIPRYVAQTKLRRCKNCGALVIVVRKFEKTRNGVMKEKIVVKFVKDGKTDDMEGYGGFVEELKTHVGKYAIVTFASEGGGVEAWDIERKPDGTFRFGVREGQNSMFDATFLNFLYNKQNMGISLRSFTPSRSDITGYPTKELRGYFVWVDSYDKIRFQQMSAEEVARSHTENVDSGKLMAPERDVIYCGPGNDRLNDKFEKLS